MSALFKLRHYRRLTVARNARRGLKPRHLDFRRAAIEYGARPAARLVGCAARKHLMGETRPWIGPFGPWYIAAVGRWNKVTVMKVRIEYCVP
jgi:hypothetical protein